MTTDDGCHMIVKKSHGLWSVELKRHNIFMYYTNV